MLLNLFYCYLSGQHDFGIRCEPGEIYLRCIHCGKRSPGWALKGSAPQQVQTTVKRRMAGKAPARAASAVASV